MTRSFGYLPGKPDPRDFNAWERLRTVKVPAAASMRQHVVEVLDQGGLGSCVANAGFQAIRMVQRRLGAEHPPLGSRLWGYFLARARHDDQKNDSGTYIRDFFAAITKFGFPAESVWPYNDGPELFARMPPLEAFRLAFDQKAPIGYRRIFQTGTARVAAVKAALAAGYPVVFGTDVSAAFAADDLGTGPLKPPVDQEIAGAHAMVTVGFDGNAFDVCNSWSPGWGAGGFCQFDASYLEWDRTADLWMVEIAPQVSG